MPAPLPSAVSARPAAFGALGGGVAAWLTLAGWALASPAAGWPPLTPVNALGAWLVRWLQSAARPALGNFYTDATLGGVVVAGVFGALAGALLAVLLARTPHAGPVFSGALFGVVLWALARWVLVPGLDPVVAELGPFGLAAGCVAWGLLVGAWLRAGRRAEAVT